MSRSQGINSRVTREQVKAQRLQNAMMADQLARPSQDIQDFGNMQNIFAGQRQSMNNMMMQPLQEEQLQLQNAGLRKINETPQVDQEQALRMQLMAQLFPQLSQQSDTTGLGQELLSMLGFDSQLGVKKNPFARELSPEELERQQTIMQAVKQLQP